MAAPDPFDSVIASPQGPAFLAQVTRLYLVVHGRPPDPDGLRTCVGHLHEGKPLRDLAASFLDSEEFRRRLGPDTVDQVLRRHVFGTDPVPGPWEGADSLPDLAAGLVLSAEAARRLPVLPALFPDGLLLRTDAEYRLWLAGRPEPDAGAKPDDPPSVSFVMAVAADDPAGMTATVRSVLALGWEGIEMLVCGHEPGAGLRQVAAVDRRLRLVRPPAWCRRGGEAGYGLARARGVFAAPIAAGEVLDRSAAPHVAAALARTDTDIVLTDEDAVDAAGLRHGPRFGGAWDPDEALEAARPGLLLARRGLLRRAGRLGRGGTVADLMLRTALLVPRERIAHVPVLWLSRPVPAPGPTPAGATLALRLVGEGGARPVDGPDGRRIVHALPRRLPRASVVIATRNRAELLARCAEGLLTRTDYPALEVVLVDNGSDEPDAEALLRRLARDRRVRVLAEPGPFNWAALNNAGVAAARGEVALLLNNDTDVIEPGWLREMVSHAVRPEVGAVGARLLFPDGTVQHAGVVLDGRGHALHMWRTWPGADPGLDGCLRRVREVVAVTGACLAIRRDVFQAVGGCDAAELPVTWNDVDLCLRVRAAGKRVIWTPHASLLHLEQASRGTDETAENHARFAREQGVMRRRWGAALLHDPFLNPNLLFSEAVPRLASRLPD